ncbi:MAG: hypothetical protein BGO74_14730 [Burkholderiales bacterium 68-12]|nr:MAG: hypothetical protein BGO74_14730 [Burkholderiales bacterium 68-12]
MIPSNALTVSVDGISSEDEMLTDMKLKALKPTGKIYKVADQQGLYVAVTRTGVVSFRFDYRVNGRRETLVIGQYDPNLGAKKPRDLVELDYGMSLSLAEARLEVSLKT